MGNKSSFTTPSPYGEWGATAVEVVGHHLSILFNCLVVCARPLGIEIIECQKLVERVEIAALRDEVSNPTGLNLLVGVNQKKLVNVFKVKVQHHQFYQELVRDVVDRTGIVRPKAMFLLQFLQ